MEVTGEPVPFITEAGLEKYIYTGGFGGDQDDIFWFCLQGSLLILNTIEPGSTDIFLFNVPHSTALYDFIMTGAPPYKSRQGVRGLPKMIRDSAS